MNELNQKLEALIDQFLDEDANLCFENRFPYLYTMMSLESPLL